jgi:CubicO group peptidase (beta-lactamase class C family)
MELELKKASLDAFETGGEFALTQEETAETIVPDYCPDIARIINTEGKIYIHGRELRDGTYTQYLGYCCYLKHPDQYFSEIPAGMSSRAFGIGGFTGNHFSVDPERGRYTVFLGNRVRDRLTVLIPPEGKRREDYGLRPDGTGRIRWTDGSVHPSSVDYVHQKDARLHAVIDRVLGGEAS